MKRKIKIPVCVLAGAVLFIGMLCSGCTGGSSSGSPRPSSSAYYSEEEHIARVRTRAEKRFLGEDSQYTGLEVYPIYNEGDELAYMLIELAPQGFMYVKINKQNSSLFGGVSMYTMSDEAPTAWSPYRVTEGDRELFRDESGEPISNFESHFKVAGIENERRYLLRTPTYEGAKLKSSSYLIPAVKRGEQYLDLVDGVLIDYEPGVYSAAYATADIYFIAKSYFDL